MPRQIHSMAELIGEIQSGIKRNDPTIMNAIKHKSGISFSQYREKELNDAAEALKLFLQKYIQDYYNSYSPKVYDRTGGLFGSVTVEMILPTEAKVYFDPSLSTGHSVFGQGDFSKVQAINYGWVVSKGGHKNIYHWGFQEGFDFIGSAIAEAQNDERFKHITIEYYPHG